jgi:hypothetical protein
MLTDTNVLNLKHEAEALAYDLSQGDPCASVHLARLIEADVRGVFRPFAEALAARLSDHLARYAELGITDPQVTLEDELYALLQAAAIDWNGRSDQTILVEEA